MPGKGKKKTTKKAKKPVKVEVYDQEEHEHVQRSILANAFTPLNGVLFVIAAILLALAMIEPGRVLDFVAAVIFIFVLIKIGYDGYNGGN